LKATAVVIGAGVDELVAAHYLARAGYAVTLLRERVEPPEDVLERGWVPAAVVRDLELERYGLRIERPDPWAIVMPEDGGLELGADMTAAVEAIHRLSPADASKWPDFCKRMHALARLLEALYTAPPPDPLAETRRGLVDLARSGWRVRRLGRHGMEDLLRLLPMSAADFLDEWFENDALKGVLGAAGVMNLCQGPRSGGTAFNLLHHHVGAASGVFRPALSNARAALSRRPGIEVRTEPVARIDVRSGRATGVTLEEGEALPASVVVSGLAPSRTLLELVDAAWLDPDFVRAVRNVRSRGPAATVSLVLDRDPRFTTLVVAPSLDYLEHAYDSVKYGRTSPEPYIEAMNLGAEAADRYRVNLHVQYVPHAPKDAVWDTAHSTQLARAAVSRLSEEVPGFSSWVIGQHVLTPDDLMHIHGFPQGQQYHAELALDQILWMRPIPALAQYRTPIDGLYLCGPAMHPGGGIAGAAGANAASVILRDLARNR
jgi:phytoene dehydrogenase-like protein